MKKLGRREFISRGLAGAASISIVPRGSFALAEPDPQSRFAPFQFPDEFIWGVATSAYQTEGAWDRDGKGESIWDRFSHTGKVKGGATGDVGCDSYHRFREDVSLAKQLNVKSYQFSISWPRIQPTGSGVANSRGLDHYKRFTDALRTADIRPVCTLYHWDLPQALEDSGGWPNRDTGSRFADYAQIVVRALGDRIADWCTFNDAWSFTFLGYGAGVHAPGRRDWGDCMRATHVVNLAQGQAFRAIKAINSKLQVGTAAGMSDYLPASSSENDRRAADRAHALGNVWFIHPALRGEYPEAFPGGNPVSLMAVQPGDIEKCRAELDFIGINYYRRQLVSAVAPGEGESAAGLQRAEAHQGPLTDSGWEVWPDGFYELVMRIAREYRGIAIDITESGCNYVDLPDRNGKILDSRRIEFMRGYLDQLGRAMLYGARVRSYHHRSLLDGFEWADGYSQRYGLVYVDFTSLKRTVKDSGKWYAKLASDGNLT